MSFSVRLMERSFQNPLTMPPIELIPERYSWHSIGGPKSAEISVQATSQDSRAMWELLEWLRCPIEIYDHNQTCVWWGYVSEVEITVGVLTVGVSLDSMHNRVAALYETSTKQKATTTWNQDDDSVSIYGTKESLLTSTVVGINAAQYLRDEILNFYKKPIPHITINESRGEMSARLTCRGWWQTLDWKYYSAISGSAIATTTQIANIITACGTFLTGTEIKNPSGISTDPFRQGDNSALFEINSLLEIGTNNGLRLVSSVSKGREVIIFAEPDLNPYYIDLFLFEDGRVENIWGDKAYASTCPVGVWAQLKDTVPGSLDYGLLADPTIFFVEEATFEVQEERYIPVARGQGAPFGVGTRISEG